MTQRWKIWIDRGGTFTDCLACAPDGSHIRVAKVLSGELAPIAGIRQLFELSEDAPIPACDIRLGTTLATNALLERDGAEMALVITRGFGDLLRIGDQTRQELFALDVARPDPLHALVLELDARVTAAGKVLSTPDWHALDEQLQELRSRGVESLAVAIIHAYTPKGAEIELAIADRAVACGFDPAHVCLSHRVSGTQGYLARAETCAVDAYLTPVLRRYLGKLQQHLPKSQLHLMTSSGTLVEPQAFRGHRAIVSGPTGGVVACRALAAELGFPQVVGFDMGGTSTDVSRVTCDGPPPRVFESHIGGVRVRTPMMAIHTVAAGGGSLCRFDGHRLSVGPESAGAQPGPLCYGHADADTLTLTDISLALGRLVGDRFPFSLHLQGVQQALVRVANGIPGWTHERVAPGFFEVAVANMAAAIARVSTARGDDIREHAMIVFGGAGGQYACAVAERLGVQTLVMHPLAGVLSALGVGTAPVGWDGVRDAGRVTFELSSVASLWTISEQLIAEGRTEQARVGHGVDGTQLHVQRSLDLRYRGTEASLSVPWRENDAFAKILQRFVDAHLRLFGYVRPEHPIEVVNVRVELTSSDLQAGPLPPQLRVMAEQTSTRGEHAGPVRHTRMFAGGKFYDDVPVWWREDLQPGAIVEGPALVLSATSTLALDPGWRVRADARGCLIAQVEGTNERTGMVRRDKNAADEPRHAADPVLLEVIGNRIMTIAEQMGMVLQRTALSTNIRERLDFSCAVFDRRGELVANAPHIPVHLGAMGESVRGVIAAHPKLEVGQVYATNDPAAGGSHLPDITVVTPVFHATGEVQFFTASRGHHADVGGLTPGSMPPYAESLSEEGICLRAVPLLRDGAFDRQGMYKLLTQGPYPARNPGENLADLEAQIAANRTGARLLAQMVDALGAQRVAAYMMHVQDHGAACVARAIAGLADGTRTFADKMDDGTPIVVAITVQGSRMQIDFSGTGPAVKGNLNAPKAVTRAAVMYVLRLLANRPIPLNSGCMRPVNLHIPPGCLLAPPPDRAVAAGNVETAQRVVDVLLAALGLAAASQGTMNNLTFGNQTFGYYETIGGGSGATATAPGAHGVHTHMTNTRITDPEVLEARFPVRLQKFGLRRGSGGNGAMPGGDGLIREFEFLQKVSVSVLSQRREQAPFGLDGGSAGKPGRNEVDGKAVAGLWQGEVEAGGRVRIETPGGGGYGSR